MAGPRDRIGVEGSYGWLGSESRLLEWVGYRGRGVQGVLYCLW